MHASISAIEYYLPEQTITTQELAKLFPSWSVDKIDAKTGIQVRHISGDDEYASDLAFKAVKKLFSTGVCRPESIDFVLLCTQSPDHLLPTTACLLQERLRIPTSAGALDFSLGCSGYVYGLGLAEGLISSMQASSVLLITADTYSKYIDPLDRSVRPLFGDGAAVTFIEGVLHETPLFGPFVYGTDGSGGPHMVLPDSGLRREHSKAKDSDAKVGDRRLRMNGHEMFKFALAEVPKSVSSLLNKAGLSHEQVDLFVFHQANKYLLDELRTTIGIPVDKFQVTISHCGNTVSSTIPIALKYALSENKLKPGALVMLVGFGVGYSWAATLIRWTGR